MSPLGLYVSFILINVSKRNHEVSKAEYCNYVEKNHIDTVQTKSLILLHPVQLVSGHHASSVHGLF